MTEKTTASGAADLPEALRLAAWLNEGEWHKMRLGDVLAAGRELRRLHALAASAPVAPAPQPELDEGRSQARVPLQQGEYLPLPIGEGTVYCNPDGSLMIDASLAFFDGAKIGDKLYTADQVCAAIDADRAARGAAQAAPAPASGEPAAYRLKDDEATEHYGKDVYVYYTPNEFKTPAAFKYLEPLYTARGEADAHYIAAANPKTVLALLSENA